jgi:hypothetical protein
MKSKDEFKTTEDYNEYLRTYISVLVCASLSGMGTYGHSNEEGNAIDAVKQADALISELNKPFKQDEAK